MGAVAEACETSAKFFGAEVRVNAGVKKIATNGGRVTGVVLESGEEIQAPLVITAIHPKITFLQQLERTELPDQFVSDIENWKTRSGTVKINLAIDRLPTFTANPDYDPEIHGGAIELLDDIEQLEQAYQDARFGQAARVPFSDTRDPHGGRQDARARGHPHGVDVQPVGAGGLGRRRGRPLARARGLRRPLDPALRRRRARVQGLGEARQIIGPKQMQEGWDLIGGNIFHGELTVDQLFHMRPAVGFADYRTPIKGLYQASSATHAGGGVTGLPGHHAVREILKDKAIKK